MTSLEAGAAFGASVDVDQGVALVVRRRREVAPEEILACAVHRGEAPFILALDGVEDPQNFGSLIRSAEAVGVHGILMASRGSAPLSPAAIKASAGAVEHLLVARVENLADELTALRSSKISEKDMAALRARAFDAEKRIKELEAENAKLKRMYADQALELTAIKDVLSRKL
mgnify:CR=1 FL=1